MPSATAPLFTHVGVIQEREHVQFVHTDRALKRVDDRPSGHVHVGGDRDRWLRAHVVSLVRGPRLRVVGSRHGLQGQLLRYEHARFHCTGVHATGSAHAAVTYVVDHGDVKNNRIARRTGSAVIERRRRWRRRRRRAHSGGCREKIAYESNRNFFGRYHRTSGGERQCVCINLFFRVFSDSTTWKRRQNDKTTNGTPTTTRARAKTITRRRRDARRTVHTPRRLLVGARLIHGRVYCGGETRKTTGRVWLPKKCKVAEHVGITRRARRWARTRSNRRPSTCYRRLGQPRRGVRVSSGFLPPPPPLENNIVFVNHARTRPAVLYFNL